MNVWIIGRGYPTPANGMWGSFELEQAKLLARKGYDVSYLALTLSFFSRKDIRGLNRFEEDEVSVYTYSHFYFPGKFGLYLKGFEDRCWQMLFNQVEETSGKPDVIHIHYPTMISSISEIDRFRNQNVKIFVTEHWSRVLTGSLKKHELERLKYYAVNANGFVCVSDSLKTAVQKIVDVKVPMEVIPNMVSPMFFEKTTQVFDEVFTFVYVGRLVALKQVDVIINQFQKTFGHDEKMKLKIIGAGREEIKLKSSINEDRRITFTGEITLEEVAHELNRASVLISYSLYETFAVPVIEAWACGKPVIVSERSGVASYVNDSNGMVIPSDSAEELGKAMASIYKRYDLYDHEDISAYAKLLFDDTAIVKKLECIYDRW